MTSDAFQYSLCRIVYCCVRKNTRHGPLHKVSIFALSNRVLLHSGFDADVGEQGKFQYSLCRIVYCCEATGTHEPPGHAFQYSLCRIVYCCRCTCRCHALADSVSIFALSNRVLLHRRQWRLLRQGQRFNIRSVESCTAAGRARQLEVVRHEVSIFALSNRVLLLDAQAVLQPVERLFQYSLCRIVYCCVDHAFNQCGAHSVSIFALSNRVLLPRLLVAQHGAGVLFQYSLCRIVYCCLFFKPLTLCFSPRFNIRSVESCTAARAVPPLPDPARCVSIFALSNRVLLPEQRDGGGYGAGFQYSLCRIVYCC